MSTPGVDAVTEPGNVPVSETPRVVLVHIAELLPMLLVLDPIAPEAPEVDSDDGHVVIVDVTVTAVVTKVVEVRLTEREGRELAGADELGPVLELKDITLV